MLVVHRLMRFPLAGGGFVLVEQADGGVVRTGSPGDALSTVTQTLAEVLGPVRDAADETLRTLREMAADPNRIEIAFGVRLTTEANAVIAKAGAEGQLAVTVVWERAPGGAP